MAIRYKVVIKDTRCSAIVKTEGYQLRYFKDTIVEAPINTLGIMVFRRRHQAEEFVLLLQSMNRVSLIVIRVESLGRGRTPKYISRWINHFKNALSHFYEVRYVNKKYKGTALFHHPNVRAPVKGTLCYDHVRVID
jgi:hypothetical protein